MINENFLLEKLKNGKNCLGTWSIIPSPIITEIESEAGLDFVIIDMEHGPIIYETAQTMVIAAESRKTSPLIRLPDISASEISRALDIGCHGLIFPNISTEKDILSIIELTSFSPNGNRGFSPFVRASNYNNQNSQKLNNSNNNILRGIIIESIEGIKNIDTFLKYDEIDLFFIGLYDLSNYLGVPGDMENHILLDYLNTLTEKILQKNKYVGTIASNLDQLKIFKTMKISFLAYLVDSQVVFNGFYEAAKIINEGE